MNFLRGFDFANTKKKKKKILVSLIVHQKGKIFKKFNSAWTCFAIFGKIRKIILTQFFYLQEVLFSIRFYTIKV